MVRIPDARETMIDLSFDTIMKAEGFVGYIGIPLIVKGKVKGVLEVFQRAPLRPYQEWLDFFGTLAGQTTIAIENSSLLGTLQAANQELLQAYDATIEGWSRALDLRDHETEGHTQRVTEMTLKLAPLAGFRDADLVHIRRGVLLHDIGKMGIPDAILLKPGPLTGHHPLLRLHQHEYGPGTHQNNSRRHHHPLQNHQQLHQRKPGVMTTATPMTCSGQARS